MGITGAARMLGVETVPVPEGDGGLRVEALRAACHAARREGRRLRICYVAPDFSNPGGNRMGRRDRERLLELAEAEDFLVLEDNVYGFTAAPGDELPSLKALDRNRRVVHLGTFSKVCFPGVRVGYVVADQEVVTPEGDHALLADHLARLKTMVTVNTPPLSQAVVAGMLLEHGGSLARRCRARSALYRRNLALLLGGLDRLTEQGLPPASAGTGRRAASSCACGCPYLPTTRCSPARPTPTGCCGHPWPTSTRARGAPTYCGCRAVTSPLNRSPRACDDSEPS